MFILVMVADPKPQKVIAGLNRQRAIAAADSYRPETADTLKAE
jgi:hypothetical protein